MLYSGGAKSQTKCVFNHGGPFTKKADVLTTGRNKTDQTAIIKDEIRYITLVMGSNNKLVQGKKPLDVLQHLLQGSHGQGKVREI